MLIVNTKKVWAVLFRSFTFYGIYYVKDKNLAAFTTDVFSQKKFFQIMLVRRIVCGTCRYHRHEKFVWPSFTVKLSFLLIVNKKKVWAVLFHSFTFYGIHHVKDENLAAFTTDDFCQKIFSKIMLVRRIVCGTCRYRTHENPIWPDFTVWLNVLPSTWVKKFETFYSTKSCFLAMIKTKMELIFFDCRHKKKTFECLKISSANTLTLDA